MTSADPPDLVVVDTNVLLAATDRSRASHQRALDFINDDQRRLALTPQIVREYLVVATRPVEANGLGMPGEGAASNMEQFAADMDILPENIATSRTVIGLVGQNVATGEQIHDANVVAVALAHGARTIVTDNTRHFARFSDSITIEPLQ
ncbi:type II toxin-antitoxin system VapC family toxin [Flexivirga caeni]|nr:PIN domain-containing protein [Flexivirga caeni]